jgi:predicted  nucleic acid-binding Zn-ribbon protein
MLLDARHKRCSLAVFMSQTNIELKNEIQTTSAQMRTLSDEIRVRLHLAGMDAKDEWVKLEPKIVEIERVATEFTETTRVAIANAVKRLTKLRSSMI